ncbi:hypothetical protein GN958_ATG13409, partial [Phytophthora infestans]
RRVETERHGEWKNKSDRRKSDSQFEKKQPTQNARPKSTASVPDKGCLKCGGSHWGRGKAERSDRQRSADKKTEDTY